MCLCREGVVIMLEPWFKCWRRGGTYPFTEYQLDKYLSDFSHLLAQASNFNHLYITERAKTSLNYNSSWVQTTTNSLA